MAFAPSPHRLPVLTEVVDVPAGAPVTTGAFRPEIVAAPAAPAAPEADAPPQALADAGVVERVLDDLTRQIDLMFEQRMRESLAPVLARLTDTLAREVRGELGHTLREMVKRAVELEIARARRP